jgi:site-specific recombinase XerD
VRVTRAIDRFLEQMQLERDFTDRSLESYASVLGRLVDDPPRGLGAELRLEDFEGRAGTDRLREHIGHNWGKTSSGTRANKISVHHTFWGWAIDEGFIETDPAIRIKRPPRRKADVYRPPAVDQDLAFNATRLHERAPWILMNEVALRASTVVETRWQDIDLTHGRIHVRVKGNHRIELPLSPVALERLQAVYRELAPDPDDYVFTVEHHRFVGNQRVVKIRDPKRPATAKSLWMMVNRICKRAGVKKFGPHALRHGFANRFLRDSERDVVSLKDLMGHSKLATTEEYLDDLKLADLSDALDRAFGHRVTSVADQGDETEGESALAAKPKNGPGWNRTTEGEAPADFPGADRADDSRPRPLTDEKRCHE